MELNISITIVRCPVIWNVCKSPIWFVCIVSQFTISNRRNTVLSKVSIYDNGKPNKLVGVCCTRRCCNSDQREDYHRVRRLKVFIIIRRYINLNTIARTVVPFNNQTLRIQYAAIVIAEQNSRIKPEFVIFWNVNFLGICKNVLPLKIPETYRNIDLTG